MTDAMFVVLLRSIMIIT